MEGKLTFPDAGNSDGSRNITLLVIQPCDMATNPRSSTEFIRCKSLDYITWCLFNSELFYYRKKIM